MIWENAVLWGGIGGAFVMLGGLTPLALLRFRRLPPQACEEAQHLAVLIPAHNEESMIAATVSSIKNSRSSLKVTVTVGADACSDSTARVAKDQGCEVQEFSFRNKWRTLSSLIANAPPDADWIALVDAGAVWSETLLSHCLPHLANPQVAAVAPSYQDAAGGLLQQALWSIERNLKLAENVAGGPVSVHGATVLVRTRLLRSAIQELSRRQPEPWWNDDIAIAFALRMMNPRLRVHYLAPHGEPLVWDKGTRPAGSDFSRRLRMVRGNLQLLSLMSELRRNCPAAFVVALRRLFRVAWAWWVTFVALGAALRFHPACGIIVLPIALFPGAAAASFLSPALALWKGPVKWA